MNNKEEFASTAASRRHDWAILYLATGERSGRKAFFDAVRSQVVLDPPVESERSWDALEDSLWEGLFQLAHDRIMIAWLDASDYATRCPDEFGVAMSVLSSVADSLAENRSTRGHPKDIEVYIA